MEQARDDFLITVDRASAFLSAAEPIPFVDSEKSDFLHIGNDPDKVRSTTRKEMQLQRDPEERAREEKECARKKEERTRKKKEVEKERKKRKLERKRRDDEERKKRGRRSAQSGWRRSF